jgi:hypothetical protein
MSLAREPVRQAARFAPLAECLLLIAHRGDPAYLEKPAAGSFAILNPAQGTKAFYAIPRGRDARAVRVLVEEVFAPTERVGEFEWALFPTGPLISRP